MIRAALALALLVGCGASALKQHATAADVAADAITAVGEQVTVAWRVAELKAVDASSTREEALERLSAVRARFDLLRAGYEAVRRSHEKYVAAIVRANARGTAVDREVLRTLVDAWAALVERARSEGLVLGGMPDALSNLARGPP